MTTTVATLTIICPDWCTVDPQEHANNLWDMGGHCYHSTPMTMAADSSKGPGHTYGEAPRPNAPVELHLVAGTAPDGHEVAAPIIYVNGHDYSLEQAMALSAALNELVHTYRGTFKISTGGAA